MVSYIDFRAIRSLPDDNTDLPPAVHELADRWRELDARAAQLDAEADQADAAVRAAELADAEALKAAVLAGEPIPAETAPTARRAAERAREALAVAVAERERIGHQLANELRRPDNRQWLAERAQRIASKPLAAYQAAIDKAEKALADAAKELRQATRLAGLVAELDAMQPPYGLHELFVTPVSLGDYRVNAERIAEALDALGERPPAPRRTVRSRANGLVLALPAATAAALAEAGDVEYVDGLPTDPREVDWSMEVMVRSNADGEVYLMDTSSAARRVKAGEADYVSHAQ